MPDTAVVTGAARGIGRAIARRLASEGWRVVLADVDAPALAEVAQELGALAVPGDTSTDAGVRHLVDTAYGHLGHVDVFFANAGIGTLAGLEATDADWASALETNVLAHVRAARHLVPRWLEAGGGRLVVTASAAGLLTMLGDAPYSVSKHGAVAFAEWLSATYRHRGIVVQAICPQGVQTRMLEESGPLQELLSRDRAISADEVAEAAWQALAGEEFYVLPHHEVRDYYAQRAAHPDAWLAGMNRLQQKLDQTSTPTSTPTRTPSQENA
ncbi:SDR family oxidoreductase [Terrabacter sp. NPDC080008]|uniref:SDR family oxidoreductase n=1 Tax=Terrabacter sp. NPDC080008 TaxID=3155176 RepID=UPI00344B519E